MVFWYGILCRRLIRVWKTAFTQFFHERLVEAVLFKHCKFGVFSAWFVLFIDYGLIYCLCCGFSLNRYFSSLQEDRYCVAFFEGTAF